MADRAYSRSPNPSARSSGVFHSLRPVESRVSLSEQFATTRREYDFGFDDAMSLFAPSVNDAQPEEHADGGGGGDDDDSYDDASSTAGASSFEGVVIVQTPSSDEDEHPKNPPSTFKRARSRDKKPRPMIARAPYEWLCLDVESATQEDIRTAYFRLGHLFRSSALDAKWKAAAEGYFVEVHRAFECLIALKKLANHKHLEITLDEDDGGTSATEEEDDDDENTGGPEDRRRRRHDARFVQRQRRQQQRPCTEVGLQVGPDPLISPRRGGMRNKSSVAFSVSETSTASLPAVSSFLEPKLRAVRHAIKARTAPPNPDPQKDDNGGGDGALELYCPPTTLQVTTALLAVAGNQSSSRASVAKYMRPVTGEEEQAFFLVPDSVPKDRPLWWGLQHVFQAPSCNVRLRQELFFRAQRKREGALLARNKTRLGLPDAVVELEADAVDPKTVVARASAAILPRPASRRGGGVIAEDDKNVASGDMEPWHVETSVSLAPGQGSSLAPRLGLAAHRRDPALGGTLFACVDSGSWWAGWPEKKAASSSWGRWSRPVPPTPWYSLPTGEVGYCFSHETAILGMPSGRPFTKQAKSGLRRLLDEADLADPQRRRQRTPPSSWTMSGAVTTGGVAAYLRYGKRLLLPLASHATKRQAQPLARDLHVEYEVCAQKARDDGLFSLDKILSGTCGQSETSHLALRCLTSVGKSSHLGLDMRLNTNPPGGYNSVVLSLYYSRQKDNGIMGPSGGGGGNIRLALPILLLRAPSYYRSHSTVDRVYAVVGLCLLGLAAVDLHRCWQKLAARKEGKEEDETEARARAKKEAKRARRYRQRRAEADELVTLLAGPVTERQQQQRQRGGLVIISAKYGVLTAASPPPPTATSSSSPPPPPQWAAPEDVADVTVAVAALVDDEGRVCIPQGVRKSHLLGFWDPEPGRTKCLVVRYAWEGKEGVRAVMGRDELRLP